MRINLHLLPVVLLGFVMFGFSRILKADDLHHLGVHLWVHRLFRCLRVSVFAFGHGVPSCVNAVFEASMPERPAAVAGNF
jgi:hypothetical protein